MIRLSPLLGLMHLGDQSQKQQGCRRVFPEAGFISGHISMRSVGKKLPGGPSEAETWLRPRGGVREASGRVQRGCKATLRVGPQSTAGCRNGEGPG